MNNSEYAHRRVIERTKELRDDKSYYGTLRGYFQDSYDAHRIAHPDGQACCLAYQKLIDTLDEKIAEVHDKQKRLRGGVM